ncbi:MAG: glutathione synthetase [Rickettsiales bacterium]|nr:glutathione synthetase [Rickettsiales bacterium]
MIDLIGYIAATLTTVSFIPQAIKTIKTKDTSGISLAMYTIFTTGVSFWLVYGILLKNPIIITSNVITFILSGSILLIKVHNCWKR